jgi:peptidoglycan hydrolase-like protein with peptidoglycan-binding domain
MVSPGVIARSGAWCGKLVGVERMRAFVEEDERGRSGSRILAAIGIMLSLGVAAAIVWNAIFAQSNVRRARNSGTIELGLAKGRSGAPVAAKAERAGGKAALADVQRELQALKLYDGPIDGRLSAETRAVLAAYRRANGLNQRSSVQDLLDHLRYSKTLRQVAGADTTSSIGSDEKTVRHVQTGLSELGFSPGPIDGNLGEATRQAIMEFEGERRLPVSGEITPALLGELAKTSGQTSFLKPDMNR